MPDMHKVVSTNIEEIGHDDQGLHVKFKTGGLFVYSGVPKAAFEAMKSAESVGKHFHQNVLGKYPHRKT